MSLAHFCLSRGLILLLADTPGCHIQPHFKMSRLPLCASLRLNVSCSRCFFSFLLFSRLAGETVSAPPCGLKFCTQSFLVKVPALKGRDFSPSALKTLGLLLVLLLLLYTSHPGSLSLSATVLVCDVLTTNGYILRDNSIP